MINLAQTHGLTAVNFAGGGGVDFGIVFAFIAFDFFLRGLIG